MPRLNRRECMQGMLATVAAAAAPALAVPKSSAAQRSSESGETIKLALMLHPGENHMVKLALQMGVTHAIASVLHPLSLVPRSKYVETLKRIKAEFNAAGITIAGVENHPVPTEKITLGLPGRDEEIENYIAAIKALSQVGVHMICYGFVAGLGWVRTTKDHRGRGDALEMAYDDRVEEKEGLTKWGRVSADQMWHNLEYFQKAVIPVAEKANVRMALHPNDPPIPEIRGIARILVSATNYRRAMNIVPSPVNGVTFDQAIFYLMGENIQELAREWCKENKIFFIHARNLVGNRYQFVETFQDNGSINFGEMFQTYYENGFRGPIRPDHDPTMDGDPNTHPGYEPEGKIFGIGYIKGIMASRNIPYS
ncbi:MAG: mannonate dehydratase [Terriglobia bacterium]